MFLTAWCEVITNSTQTFTFSKCSPLYENHSSNIIDIAITSKAQMYTIIFLCVILANYSLTGKKKLNRENSIYNKMTINLKKCINQLWFHIDMSVELQKRTFIVKPAAVCHRCHSCLDFYLID